MLGYILILHITIALMGLTENSGGKTLQFKYGDCNYNRDTLSNFTLQIKNHKVKMDMTLIRVLPLGLKAHVGFELRLSKSNDYQSVFEHDINYCQMLRGMQQSIYRRWFTTMLNVGNFATSCPVAMGYYYLKEWTIDSSLVPSFLYLGDYRIDFAFFYGKYRNKNDNPLLLCTVNAILV